MRGSLYLSAYSTSRVTFSPTAADMLPMKKRLSRAHGHPLAPDAAGGGDHRLVHAGAAAGPSSLAS